MTMSAKEKKGRGRRIGPRTDAARPNTAGAAARATEREHHSHRDTSRRSAAEEKLAKISGLAAVRAVFQRDPDRILRLYYSERAKGAAGPLCAKLAEMRRIYRLVSDEELARIAGTVLHGGIVAAVRHRDVQRFDTEVAEGWARSGDPLVVLDGVGNPHNLGAIARTLAFFGIPRLLLSGHPAQAGLSDAAYRVAEGGLEYLEIFATAHLPSDLTVIRDSYRVIGTALRRGRPLAALPPDPRPICLVLGNEEEGLPTATVRACEALVTISGSGAVQSLNVAATAAILVSEIVGSIGQRRTARTRAIRPRDRDRAKK